MILEFFGLTVSITGVEWWDVALIALPELIALVLCVLRRRPVVFVGVVGVHIEGHDITLGMSM